MAHSILSASSAHRWLNCPASVAFTADMPDAPSSYAEEGTRAHELGAYKLSKLRCSEASTPSAEDYDQSMQDYTDGYAEYVAEYLTDDSAIFIEQSVDYSEVVGTPNSFGTADCIIISGSTLHIIDLKYGMGVPVSAERNPQLMLYALGAYSAFGDLYDITDVSLHIYQPRLANISEWSLSLAELLKICAEEFAPVAQEAREGSDRFVCGDWCRFCRGKNICRKRAEANLQQCKLDFPLPPKLSDTEIEALLPKLDDIVKWASELKEYALDEALKGKKWRGYKIVEGRSVRKYADEKAVADIVTAEGYDPYEHKLLGLTAMSKLLGKKHFEELLASQLVKTEGKPTLVTEADKRPELKTSAVKDFAE